MFIPVSPKPRSVSCTATTPACRRATNHVTRAIDHVTHVPTPAIDHRHRHPWRPSVAGHSGMRLRSVACRRGARPALPSGGGAQVRPDALRTSSRKTTRQSGSLVQQRTDLRNGVIDFDLKHRISRLQLSTRGFCTVGRIKLRLEMAVDDCREPFSRRSVGSYRLLRFRLVDRENGLFHCSSFPWPRLTLDPYRAHDRGLPQPTHNIVARSSVTAALPLDNDCAGNQQPRKTGSSIGATSHSRRLGWWTHRPPSLWRSKTLSVTDSSQGRAARYSRLPFCHHVERNHQGDGWRPQSLLSAARVSI